MIEQFDQNNKIIAQNSVFFQIFKSFDKKTELTF